MVTLLHYSTSRQWLSFPREFYFWPFYWCTQNQTTSASLKKGRPTIKLRYFPTKWGHLRISLWLISADDLFLDEETLGGEWIKRLSHPAFPHKVASRSNRELKQTRGRRKRERHLNMWLRVSATTFQLFKLIMLEKCVLTILELNWNHHWDIRRQNSTFVIICSRRPHNCKTGLFTS